MAAISNFQYWLNPYEQADAHAQQVAHQSHAVLPAHDLRVPCHAIYGMWQETTTKLCILNDITSPWVLLC